jgi:hypothetical protein
MAGTSQAELLKNFSYGGQLDVNAYSINNYADLDSKIDDKISYTDTRLMLNAGFDLSENASAAVTAVKNDRQYGQAAQNINGIENKVYFTQAYVDLKGVLGLDHNKLGRQYYGEPQSLVIYAGPNTWPFTQNMYKWWYDAIDGWTGSYKAGNWDLNALVGRLYVGTTGFGKQYKGDVNGFDAKTSVNGLDLNGYIYQYNGKTLCTASACYSQYLDIGGLRAAYAVPQLKGLTVAGEYDQNMGKNTFPLMTKDIDYRGYAYKLKAAYAADLKGKFTAKAERIFTSGDNDNTDKKNTAYQTFADDYRPGIIYTQWGFNTNGAVYPGNLVNDSLALSWTPAALSKLTIEATAYQFRQDKLVSGNSDKHIADEYDLVATWKHSDKTSVKGYCAALLPEKNNNASHDPITMFGAAFELKF